MELKDRIKLARNAVGVTQGELVSRIHHLPGGESFSQQALSKLERGEAETSSYLVHIAVATGVNPEWLVLEQGAMVGDRINISSFPEIEILPEEIKRQFVQFAKIISETLARHELKSHKKIIPRKKGKDDAIVIEKNKKEPQKKAG